MPEIKFYSDAKEPFQWDDFHATEGLYLYDGQTERNGPIMSRKYIFTDKRESKKGIMSTVFGLIAGVSVIYSLYEVFQAQGQAMIRYGMAVLFSLIFALVGMVLGVMSKMEQNRFYVFSWIGMILNALTILGIGFMIYAGVR